MWFEEQSILQEGICRGVFEQEAAAAWYGAGPEKVQITIVLPWAGIVDDWCDALSLAQVAPTCDYE